MKLFIFMKGCPCLDWLLVCVGAHTGRSVFLIPCKMWLVQCPLPVYTTTYSIYNSIHWTSHFLQDTRKTRPCITGISRLRMRENWGGGVTGCKNLFWTPSFLGMVGLWFGGGVLSASVRVQLQPAPIHYRKHRNHQLFSGFSISWFAEFSVYNAEMYTYNKNLGLANMKGPYLCSMFYVYIHYTLNQNVLTIGLCIFSWCFADFFVIWCADFVAPLIAEM